ILWQCRDADDKSHCRRFERSSHDARVRDQQRAKYSAVFYAKVSSDAARLLNSSFRNQRGLAQASSSEAKVKQQSERPLLPVQRQCSASPARTSHLGPNRHELSLPLSTSPRGDVW